MFLFKSYRNSPTIKEYERQIDPVRSGTLFYDTSNGVDQMVYELYGLTDEEIKIVEQFIK